ncbi:hypothetical protein H5410_057028 [Solanum commersonii]|uniref:Uncharacterized protein n=1 Tax=Solanum commersonii TaxID=4109 RepID=A0A9J5WPQ8_SOLCO|nr:hypothetical protein H5410_057028 [Solanum commersonii]
MHKGGPHPTTNKNHLSSNANKSIQNINLGISARSHLIRNSSARSTRGCCGQLNRQCLDHRLHNHPHKI